MSEGKGKEEPRKEWKDYSRASTSRVMLSRNLQRLTKGVLSCDVDASSGLKIDVN
jgi:hypothetical protein